MTEAGTAAACSMVGEGCGGPATLSAVVDTSPTAAAVALVLGATSLGRCDAGAFVSGALAGASCDACGRTDSAAGVASATLFLNAAPFGAPSPVGFVDGRGTTLFAGELLGGGASLVLFFDGFGWARADASATGLPEGAAGAAPSGSSVIASEGMADTLTTCLVKPGAEASATLAMEPRAESGPASDLTPNKSGSVPLRRRVLSGEATSALDAVGAPFEPAAALAGFASVPFDGATATFDFGTTPVDFAMALLGFAMAPLDFPPIAHPGRRARTSASARSASNPRGGFAKVGAVPFEESALPISEDFSLGLDIEMVEERITAHAHRQCDTFGSDLGEGRVTQRV